MREIDPNKIPADVPVDDVIKAQEERKALSEAAKNRNQLKKMKPEELREAMKISLETSNPADNASLLSIESSSQMVLPVMSIELYDKNPRQRENDQYDEIKSSIINTRGMQSTLTVTRRPGANNYMVSQGGNTRLRAQQDAFLEAIDPKLKQDLSQVVVMFKPWQSESHVMTAHLVENMVRADMCYWDSALGIMNLKQMLEAEAGREFSVREFVEKLKAIGLPKSRAQIAYYTFTVKDLSALGKATQSLTGIHVKLFQPLFNVQSTLAQSLAPQEDWIKQRNDVLAAYEQTWLEQYQAALDNRQVLLLSAATPDEVPEVDLPRLDVERLSDLLTAACASLIGKSPEFVKRFQTVSETHSSMEFEELMALASVQPKTKRNTKESPLPSSTPEGRALLGSESEALADVGAQLEADSESERMQPLPSAPPLPLGEPPAYPKQALFEALHAAIKTFSEITSVDDLLRFEPSMPLGFYMEVPNEALDLSGEAWRYGAWWILAYLSLQFDRTESLPKESMFSRIVNDTQEDPNLGSPPPEFMIQSVLGGELSGHSLLLWMSDPENPALEEYFKIQSLYRSARAHVATIFEDPLLKELEA